MEITIFAKRRTSKEGKQFFQYLTTLTKLDGTTETMRVCFRNVDAPKAESCPRNIIVERDGTNIAIRHYKDAETGESRQNKTLWVSAWESGSEYVDHSLDEYNFE